MDYVKWATDKRTLFMFFLWATSVISLAIGLENFKSKAIEASNRALQCEQVSQQKTR